jgi:hypothetical protein
MRCCIRLRHTFRCITEKPRKAAQMQVLRNILFFSLFTLVATAQSNLVVLSLNSIQFADQQTGADACVKIQKAIAALPVNGGEVDARGFLGFQACSVNPFANIFDQGGKSVHLYLAAGSTYMTLAEWVIPTASIVTGGGRAGLGGGAGTTIMAVPPPPPPLPPPPLPPSFPKNTPVIFLGDPGSPSGIGQGARVENLTIDCRHVQGCTGVFSDRVQEQGGVRNLTIYNYPAFGIQMLDQGTLPPNTGGQPENYILDELELAGDPGSTCIDIRVGTGGQRGGAHITCTSSLVQLGNLSCSSGVVTATFSANAIPNGAAIGVESGTNPPLNGLFIVTNSSGTQLQWAQPGCSGSSTGALVGQMAQNGVQMDGADGVYSQIHCEFTVDCVLTDAFHLQDGWVTRTLTISGVTGQASVKNIVHLGDATSPEDIVLTALQRCIGPTPATQQCATNVLQDDFAGITLQDASLAWYLLGHSSTPNATPAVLSSSPAVNWFLPNPFLIFRNSSSFSQLGGKTNGSFTYCSDCTVADPSSCSAANPSACVCASGGAGAFAKRVNATWACN